MLNPPNTRIYHNGEYIIDGGLTVGGRGLFVRGFSGSAVPPDGCPRALGFHDRGRCAGIKLRLAFGIWVVVKIMVPFWIPIIIRPLIFRVPKKGTIILTTTHLGFRGSGPGWIVRLFGSILRQKMTP